MTNGDEGNQDSGKRGQYKEHDPWVKDLIALSGKWNLFPELEIPRSTAKSWIEGGYKGFDPKLETFAEHYVKLDHEVDELKRSSFLLNARVKLMTQIQSALGTELNTKKIRSKPIRAKILSMIEQAIQEGIPRSVCLSTSGLTSSRYKRWRREEKKCKATPTRYCVQLNINGLTPKEIKTMRSYVTSKKLSHFTIKGLHFLAKREGKLHCCYSTWNKYVALTGWRRPNRKKKKKPRRKRGIRAAHPNQIWHLDLTKVILLNKSQIYVQAIEDNYSRYVLAWDVSAECSGIKTTRLTVKALRQSYAVCGLKIPDVWVDGGTENNNAEVETLVDLKLIHKTIAQTDVDYSNSMIEAVFRSLKGSHLNHKILTGLKAVKREVDFYLTEFNDHMPHSAFQGETPKERYLQSWTEANQIFLVVQHEEAKKLRAENNRLVFCRACEPNVIAPAATAC